MYMASAMADLAFELDDDELKRACEALWRDVTTAQMYVTAGLGPERANEGFTEPYDLPNETAYAETCASVALVFWAQRMLHLDLDGGYADVMERALYNGALSGLSREGTHYFYANPLESRGQHRRWAWHVCPCCTMNVSRLVASIGGYAFRRQATTGSPSISTAAFETTLAIGGAKVRLRETSDYPWSGDIRIEVDPESAGGFRPEAAHSGMGKRRRGGCQRRAGPRSSAARGYATIHRRLEQGRRRHAPSADAVRAPLRPSERAHGRRTGRAEARPAHLLRRGGRQSRRLRFRRWRCRVARSARGDMAGGPVRRRDDA